MLQEFFTISPIVCHPCPLPPASRSTVPPGAGSDPPQKKRSVGGTTPESNAAAIKKILNVEPGSCASATGRLIQRRASRSGPALGLKEGTVAIARIDRKSTRLNSSHGYISYAVFCLKKKRAIFIVIERRHHCSIRCASATTPGWRFARRYAPRSPSRLV